jgi:hypothetical protein
MYNGKAQRIFWGTIQALKYSTKKKYLKLQYPNQHFKNMPHITCTGKGICKLFLDKWRLCNWKMIKKLPGTYALKTLCLKYTNVPRWLVWGKATCISEMAILFLTWIQYICSKISLHIEYSLFLSFIPLVSHCHVTITFSPDFNPQTAMTVTDSWRLNNPYNRDLCTQEAEMIVPSVEDVTCPICFKWI